MEEQTERKDVTIGAPPAHAGAKTPWAPPAEEEESEEAPEEEKEPEETQ